MEVRQYEFSSSQNQLIKQLADKMRFVSYFLISVGVLNAIIGIIGLFSTALRGSFGEIITGILLSLLGFWTNKASISFKRIVNTQGSDIENLMGALSELRKLYTLQYWLLIITLIFIVIGIVLAIALPIILGVGR
ncbi:MAG: hypothetical protein AB1589_01235 [Cyanobacteriota bacterium]